MTKKDILELKRRFKKEACTFTRMCGCYVDAERNKVVRLGETFLNLEDEEFHKYLEIANKALSGTLGNNLLELEFPLAEESNGGRQQFFMALRESKLKNEELLERFYDLIIENYDYAGNYLILIFHDAYDVITKTSDQSKLDESEEVYEYLLCAVCPVTLSKPGLGYRADENRIGPRIRDWVVGKPDAGFLFPAFTDRSCDIHACAYYTKNPKEPHAEFMEGVLGCDAKRTAAEQKQVFQSIIETALPDKEKSQEIFCEIQHKLNDMLTEKEDSEEEAEDALLLTSHTISELIPESDVPRESIEKIEQTYSEEFGDMPPNAQYLFDPKAAEAGAQKRKEKELVQKVHVLQKQLEEKALPMEEDPDSEVKTYDVILRVKPEKAPQIKSQIINGQKCLVIPMDENEHAAVNGVNTIV